MSTDTFIPAMPAPTPLSPIDAAYVDGVIFGMELASVILLTAWLAYRLPGWVASLVWSYRAWRAGK
jgi:hypothetical protein